MGNIRHAGLGGLFRNSERSIVLAFPDLAGICSIDRAKVEVLWNAFVKPSTIIFNAFWWKEIRLVPLAGLQVCTMLLGYCGDATKEVMYVEI